MVLRQESVSSHHLSNKNTLFEFCSLHCWITTILHYYRKLYLPYAKIEYARRHHWWTAPLSNTASNWKYVDSGRLDLQSLFSNISHWPNNRSDICNYRVIKLYKWKQHWMIILFDFSCPNYLRQKCPACITCILDYISS